MRSITCSFRFRLRWKGDWVVFIDYSNSNVSVFLHLIRTILPFHDYILFFYKMDYGDMFIGPSK